MEKTIVLRDTVPEDIKRLFEFFEPTVLAVIEKYGEFSPLMSLRKVCPLYVEKYKITKENYISHENILKSFNIWDKENYVNYTEDDEEKIFINTMERARGELYCYFDANLSGRAPHKLIRVVSPPLEAYKYKEFGVPIGKPTGRDFGLLFEG